MNTVPRPAGAPDTSDADQLRELLGRIAQVLDVPADGDMEQARILTRDRAILVRHAALTAASGSSLDVSFGLLHGLECLAEGGAE